MRAYPRPSKLSRRGVLAGLLTLGAAPILQACAAATPTPAPPKPTEPPKPAAPAAAPTDTAAPAKPAEAPKPTEAPKAAEATKPGPEGTPAPKPAAAAPGAAQPKTVKVVDWVAETIDSWANRHYKPFQDANPNIKIVHEQISQRYIETVLTRLSGSSDIDIIGAAPNSTGSFLRSGGALDLTPMIQSDSQMLQIDKFPRWTLDDYTLKRYPDLNVLAGQYGVPLVMFVWQFWHNTDLYNEAGVSVPKRGWTWDDFVSISKKVTDQSKKRYGYQNQNWLLPLWPWVWQNGGDALSEDGKRLTIGSPAVIETFSFLQKLAVEDKLFPAPETTTKEGGSINFDSGATGMITRGNWNLDLSRDWKFKWDISYPPKGKQEATIGEEVGYIISKSTTKKDETWTFVRWTLSPEGQRINAVRDVVPNTDVMKELGLSKVPENVRNVVVPLSGDPMVRAYPQWYRPKYTPDDLQGRLAVLWTGEKKASELLPALEKEFNEALSKPIA